VKRIKWVAAVLIALGLAGMTSSAWAYDWDDCAVWNPIRLCQEK
jgi:hypothetical protein